MKESTKFIKRECERIYNNADKFLKRLYIQDRTKKDIQNTFECYLVDRCHEDIEWLLVVAETETAKKYIANLMKKLEYILMTTYRTGICKIYGSVENTFSYNTITKKFNAVKIDTMYNVSIVSPHDIKDIVRTADVYRTHHGNLMVLLV